MRCLVVAVLLAAAVAPAAAQDSPPLGPQDVSLKFRTPPQNFFPLDAQRFGDHGKAGALCTIQAEGSLSDCSVVDEAPAGKHFGEAALKIAGSVKIEPLAKDGSKTAGRRFLLRVNF